MKMIFAILSASLACLFSCKKLPNLVPTPLDIAYNDSAKFFHITDITYTRGGDPGEYVIKGHYTIDWSLLSVQKPMVESVQIYFDRPASAESKDKESYYFYQFVKADTGYCPRLVLIDFGGGKSRGLAGDCITVPY